MGKDRPLYARREFLKQAGAAAGVAIPFLRSQVAMGQTTVAPVRLLIVPLTHGWGLGRDVKPITGTETNFTLPAVAQAFNSIKEHMVFVDGVRTDVWGNAHDRNYSSMLTCSTRFIGENTTAPNAYGGPFSVPTSASLDWILSQHLNKPVLRFSHGYRSWGATFNPLSFDNNIRNLPFYTNPRAAYMDIIDPLKQVSAPTAPPGTSEANNALFSLLGKDTDRMLRMLTGSERSKMEGYLASLNSLGSRILSPNTGINLGNISLPNEPASGISFEAGLSSYLDMIRVAFTLNTHSVAILGLGEGVSNWTWTNSGGAQRVGNTFGNDFHHEVAHYGSTDARNAYEGWVNWYATRIVSFVNSLNAITDVDGRRLLDNTIIVLTGEVGDGQHDTIRMVVPVIGGGGNRIRRNRWLHYPVAQSWQERDASGTIRTFSNRWGDRVGSRHLADLWVSISRLMGLNINTFGTDVNNSTPIELA